MGRTTLAAKAPAARQAPKLLPAAPQPGGRSWIRRLRDALVDLVFPPQCSFCSVELEEPPKGQLLCIDCLRQLSTPIVRCPACASPAPMLPTPDGRCPVCRQEKPAFEQARVVGAYQDQVRQAVLRIKHASFEPLAVSLGGLLAERISQIPFPAIVDLVVPVPMYWVRRLWRGTSAAQTLAEKLSTVLSIPLADDLVSCTRWMAKQSSLPASERRDNVRGAYAVSSAYDIRGATILVVDDVITTAATCDEVARVLLRAGAARVFATAVARSGGNL